MTLPEALRDYGSPIAWFVAAIGWWVSSAQANKRERRKEVRSEIDDIGEVLTSLSDAVRAYYKFRSPASLEVAGSGTDEAVDDDADSKQDAALQIKALTKEVDLRMQRLMLRRWSYPAQQHLKEAKKVWERIYESVTGKYFETSESMESAEVVNALFLRTRVQSIQFVEKLHSAALAHFDFF